MSAARPSAGTRGLVGLFTAWFLAVAAISAVLVIDLRTPEAGPVERPGPCVQNGRFTFNTGPCVYNPRTDTCPDYNLMNYANACFIVVPEGRP